MEDKVWQDKVKAGMRLIAEGCLSNHHFTICGQCPFNNYCDAIQIGAEAGLDVDIPENWDGILYE